MIAKVGKGTLRVFAMFVLAALCCFSVYMWKLYQDSSRVLSLISKASKLCQENSSVGEVMQAIREDDQFMKMRRGNSQPSENEVFFELESQFLSFGFGLGWRYDVRLLKLDSDVRSCSVEVISMPLGFP